jgi:hypothetical protein
MVAWLPRFGSRGGERGVRPRPPWDPSDRTSRTEPADQTDRSQLKFLAPATDNRPARSVRAAVPRTGACRGVLHQGERAFGLI